MVSVAPCSEGSNTGVIGVDTSLEEQTQQTAAQLELPPSTRSLGHRWFSPLTPGSQRAAVLALTSTAFGAGTLTLPWVFSELGIIFGLLMLVSAAFLSMLSQRLLANAAYATGLTSYSAIVEKVIGHKTAVLLEICLCVFVFGVAVNNFVFFGQTAPQVFASLRFPRFLVSSARAPTYSIILASVAMSPLVFMRTLASLRYATMLSVSSLCLVALVLCFVVPAKMAELVAHADGSLSPEWWILPHIQSWETIPRCVSMTFLAFTCHANLFAKYRELEDPTSVRVQKVFLRSALICTVVYGLIAACGFLAFGLPCTEAVPTQPWPACVPVNILAAPRFNGATGVVTRMLLLLMLLVATPINLIATRDIVLQWLLISGVISPNSPAYEDAGGEEGDAASPSLRAPQVVCLVLSLCVLLLSAFLAIVCPSVKIIMSLLGGGCAVTFMFTLPILITLLLYFRQVDTPHGVQRGMLGKRRVLGTQQIGNFLGVTKRGVVVLTVVTLVPISLGYVSVLFAMRDVLLGGHT